MKRNPKLFLEHILESITLIEEYTQDVTKETFMESMKVQDMVLRRLEIIGEAVKNIPEDIKSAHADIPWKSIAGMRDKLIHQYFSIDLKLTWNVVKNQLPTLKQNISAMLENWNNDEQH